MKPKSQIDGRCTPTNLETIVSNATALIFDCDGTLVKTPELYAKAWRKAFGKAGHSMDSIWYHQRAGMSEHVLMDEFATEFGAEFDREQVIECLRQAVLEEIHTLTEITVVAAIARAQAGLKPMAVASGGPREIVLASLDAAGLTPLFDTVVTIDDVAAAKPAPDLFLEAAHRLGVPADGCLVLEDSPQGLLAAQNAGMAVVDVNDLSRW